MTIPAVLLGLLVCVCVMAQGGYAPAPLACNTKAFSAGERPRYLELLGKIKAAVKDRRELRDGFAFRLNDTAVVLQELAEWVTMERRCCPFLSFRIETSGTERDFWLTLRGPAGVKPFLREELAFDGK
jgi:hypothetical protein